MAITQPEVEWVYDLNTFTRYGLLCLAGKWAVVGDDPSTHKPAIKFLTPWLDDRRTAVGFLKLLREQ